MLVCFVVSATGVAVAWLLHCLCTGNLQWKENLGARRCTGSTLLMLSFLLGLHMLDAYSRVGLTKVVYHCALMVVGQRLTLRPMKAKVEFAFLVILSMWLSQLKLLWMMVYSLWIGDFLFVACVMILIAYKYNMSLMHDWTHSCKSNYHTITTALFWRIVGCNVNKLDHYERGRGTTYYFYCRYLCLSRFKLKQNTDLLYKIYSDTIFWIKTIWFSIVFGV